MINLMWVLVTWSKVAAGLCFCCSFYLGHLQAVPVDLGFLLSNNILVLLSTAWIIFTLYKPLIEVWLISVWQVVCFVIINRN